MSGLKAELEHSLHFHQEGIPLLISPILLRQRNLGQIDLARLRKTSSGWLVELAEVKSSEVGVKEMQTGQRRRLYSAQSFLCSLFGCPGRLIALIK